MSKKITFIVAEAANRDTYEKSYNAQWNIPALIQVKDTRLNKEGRRSYIRYISYEQSIWADDQSTEFDLVKHRFGQAVRLEKPSFINGFLQVDEDDLTLLKFLREHPFNVKNSQRNEYKGKRFFELNTKEIARENLEHTKSEFDLLRTIFDMDVETLKTTALLTGVLNSRDLYSKTTDELRNDLIVLARRDPNDFYAAIDDDLADYKKIIYEALNLGVLKYDGKNVIEYNNGNRFVSSSLAEDPVELGAEKLADKGNLDVLNSIKRRIRQAKGENVVSESESEATQKMQSKKKEKSLLDAPSQAAAEVENMTIDTLVGAAASAGIFSSTSPFYTMVTEGGDVKLYVGGGKNKWKSAAVEFLSEPENEEHLETLKTKYFLWKKSN